MVAQPSRSHSMSVDEWRELEQRSYDVKHEYIDGLVYAMAGGTLAHSFVAGNVVTLLNSMLRGGPCRAYSSDAAVRLSSARYTYPDATVSCDEGDRPTIKLREIQAPRVVVEVLSDTTEAYDRGDKFGYYRECSSVQEYVLVSTRRQLLEVYCRTPEGWVLHVYGRDDKVELISVGMSFPLAALYELTDIPEIIEAPKGGV